jgi:hypothetical protein
MTLCCLRYRKCLSIHDEMMLLLFYLVEAFDRGKIPVGNRGPGSLPDQTLWLFKPAHSGVSLVPRSYASDLYHQGGFSTGEAL